MGLNVTWQSPRWPNSRVIGRWDESIIYSSYSLIVVLTGRSVSDPTHHGHNRLFISSSYLASSSTNQPQTNLSQTPLYKPKPLSLLYPTYTIQTPFYFSSSYLTRGVRLGEKEPPVQKQVLRPDQTGFRGWDSGWVVFQERDQEAASCYCGTYCA